MLEQLLQLLDCETRADTDQRRCAIATTAVGAVAARALRLVNGDPSPSFTTRHGCGMRFPHRGNPRHVTRVDVQCGGFEIHRPPAPPPTTLLGWQNDPAPFSRRGGLRVLAPPTKTPPLRGGGTRLT